MAIDKFAKSLISDASKKNKDSKKNDLVYSLAKFAGRGAKSLLTTALTDSSNTFQRKEKLMAEKLKYKEAITDASGFINTQKLIDDSGKTSETYFYDNHYASAKAKLLETLPLEISGNERLLASFVRKQLDPHTKKLAADHAKGLKLSGTIDTFENYTTDFNTKLKKVRPDNVGDALFGSIGRLFSGKTKAEQEDEVLASIRTGPMSKSATAMTAFDEEYKKTRNSIRSFKIAELLAADEIKKIIDEEKDILVTTDKTHNVTADGTVYLATKTITENKITTEKDTDLTVEIVDSLTDPAEDKLKQAQSMTSAVNLAKFPKTVLRPPAYANFVKSIINSDLNPMDVKTPEDYAAIARVLATFTANPANLQDQFSDGVLTASVSALAKEGSGLPELLLSLNNLTPGSTDYIKLSKQIETTRLAFYKSATLIQGVVIANQNLDITPVTPRPVIMTPTVNKHSAIFNKAQWSAFTPAQKAAYNTMTAAQIKSALKP